jgi:O-succinylbenzoate synthase
MMMLLMMMMMTTTMPMMMMPMMMMMVVVMVVLRLGRCTEVQGWVWGLMVRVRAGTRAGWSRVHPLPFFSSSHPTERFRVPIFWLSSEL